MNLLLSSSSLCLARSSESDTGSPLAESVLHRSTSVMAKARSDRSRSISFSCGLQPKKTRTAKAIRKCLMPKEYRLTAINTTKGWEKE